MNGFGQLTAKNDARASPDGPIALVATDQAAADAIVTEIEVLPNHDFGMTRKAVFVDNRLFHEFRIDLVWSEFGWMPQRWTFSYYSPAGDLLESAECEVVERHFNSDLQSVEFRAAHRAVAGDRHRSVSSDLSLVTGLPHNKVHLADRQRIDVRLGALLGALIGMMFLLRWVLRTTYQRSAHTHRAHSTERTKISAWTYRKHRHCFQTPIDASARRTRR